MISTEIVAFVPGEISQGFARRPSGDKEGKLYDLARRKQMHRCQPTGCQSKMYGDVCKYGFPGPLCDENGFNESTGRYKYKRPHSGDRNVVPYHPNVLLFWGAHCNVKKNAMYNVCMLLHGLSIYLNMR